MNIVIKFYNLFYLVLFLVFAYKIVLLCKRVFLLDDNFFFGDNLYSLDDDFFDLVWMCKFNCCLLFFLVFSWYFVTWKMFASVTKRLRPFAARHYAYGMMLLCQQRLIIFRGFLVKSKKITQNIFLNLLCRWKWEVIFQL